MKAEGNTLYLECNSGISGDMTVAALLDLGADREVLKKVLRSIPVQGFRIKISRVKKAGLDVCDFHVILDDAHENHDHDMEYLFGGEHRHEEVHSVDGEILHEEAHHHEGEKQHGEEHHHHEGHEHPHSHEHPHDHNHEHSHHHEHRGLPEILHIIEQTDMTEGAKETAERIFRILAKAEAKAHGLPENEVHFHEVGAVDSIVDIISVAVCLDNLGVTECIVPALCEGTGTIRCQHGVMSVPVPAVLNIVQENHLELSITDIKGELVTPTGAAIAAAVKTADKLPKRFRVVKTGMGGGKREYERPSILRAMLIEKLSEPVNCKKEDESGRADGAERNPAVRETDMVNGNDNFVENNKNRGDRSDRDVIYKLETNIDDCSGEVLGYVMDRLMEAGARDVHYMPVYMKKNRPAWQLNVICREEQIPELESIIFAETTTIGIRRQRMERSVLPRRRLEILTEQGNAVVKECLLPDHRGVRYYPEYESIAKLCRASGKSFGEMYHLVLEQCRKEKPGHAGKRAVRGLKVRKFWKRKYEDLS